MAKERTKITLPVVYSATLKYYYAHVLEITGINSMVGSWIDTREATTAFRYK